MLISVSESAKRLSLSEHTLRAAIRSGAIPAIRLGRRVLIAEATLEALERVGHPTLTKKKRKVRERPGVGR